MKIPKEFKLFGQTIKVKWSDTLIEDEDCLGQALYRKNLIILQKNNKAISKQNARLEEIFLHELMHFILHKMGKKEMANDEEFIDTFAGLLHQALTTMK